MLLRFRSRRKSVSALVGALAVTHLFAIPAQAQKAPPDSARPWTPGQSLELVTPQPKDDFRLATDTPYALTDLINLAEQRNPATRSSWEAAKAAAGNLGVARSDLYPTLTAIAAGQTVQQGVLLYDTFVKQILGIGEGSLNLNYTIFDFGARLDRVETQRANLLRANLSFNDTHRKIIFDVARSYYQLLNANGQQKAAEANLANAKAVQQAAEARLENGLATLPDVLETRSASAQAEYDLQATIGASEEASGDLATLVRSRPDSQFQVQSIDSFHVPAELAESVDDLISKALVQRPDLLARMQQVKAAEARVKEARTDYYPKLTFQGTYGYLRGYGEQPPYAGDYGSAPVYSAQLNLTWTVFDGGKRRANTAEALADQRRAQAEVDSARDQISDEVWRSYSQTKTALRQRHAADTLLETSDTSYRAALESYNYGVRNILDVLSAQRALAQARAADVSARTRVLTSFADLAYRTADLLHQQNLPTSKP
jgi:outer membrane protein